MASSWISVVILTGLLFTSCQSCEFLDIATELSGTGDIPRLLDGVTPQETSKICRDVIRFNNFWKSQDTIAKCSSKNNTRFLTGIMQYFTSVSQAVCNDNSTINDLWNESSCLKATAPERKNCTTTWRSIFTGKLIFQDFPRENLCSHFNQYVQCQLDVIGQNCSASAWKIIRNLLSNNETWLTVPYHNETDFCDVNIPMDLIDMTTDYSTMDGSTESIFFTTDAPTTPNGSGLTKDSAIVFFILSIQVAVSLLPIL